MLIASYVELALLLNNLTTFSQMLKHLRQLWDDELYCDVVLKVGDKLIKSHRVVLCAGSRLYNNS